VAALDERDAPAGPRVSEGRLRVALDLDGSLESLGDSMTDLADALEATGEVDLVRWRSRRARASDREVVVRGRALWAPWWRRGRGPAIERFVDGVDVVHVAGRLMAPTRAVPLVVSVDDLRPLRGEGRERPRVRALERVARRGAWLVASTRAARREVVAVRGADPARVVVVPPAVPIVAPTLEGTALVINVTGVIQPVLDLARPLSDLVRAKGGRVVVLASEQARAELRALGDAVELLARDAARAALARGRVVWHVSDGARFPSFAIAALAAGVPTVARATAINRELLDGAAALTESDGEVRALVDELWANDERRALAAAAGRARAADFAPPAAARAYVALYREVVRGWTP
jgi:D-inositol-3-phosphate glycosyltransferase